MPKRFDGKVVIVTGSSSGIGQSTAILFAEEGAKVTITGRSEENLNKTRDLLIAAGASKSDVLIIAGDITEDSVQHRIIEETVEKFGKLDVLVNNAGGTEKKPPGVTGFDLPMENYDYVMNINTRAILVLTKLAIPHLKASKGEVVMVSSVAGCDRAAVTGPYYAMSKACVNQLTRALATKYISDGIRVNAVSPGIVHTPIFEREGLTADRVDNFMKNVCSHKELVPAGIPGQPRDIANAIAFLADRSISSYIVGHVLIVDGGTSITNGLMMANFADYL